MLSYPEYDDNQINNRTAVQTYYIIFSIPADCKNTDFADVMVETKAYENSLEIPSYAIRSTEK